jgi:prepilin-type N-terminal cleavage/methylation domain-containing protein
MNGNNRKTGVVRPACFRSHAFTLIELLTVIAIIGLLIAILLPSLQAARAQAKAVQTRGQLKAIGDAVEMFRNENESERELRENGGYPPSKEGDDPTKSGEEYNLYGAHWLVRYLMGADLKGYVPRRFVPRSMQDRSNLDDEQREWYLLSGPNHDKPLDRVGPYLPAKSKSLVATRELPGQTEGAISTEDMDQPVFVDSFGFPVLYYVANAAQARRPDANMAVFNAADVAPDPQNRKYGIYSFADNGFFTGACAGVPEGAVQCAIEPWNFVGDPEHKIKHFGLDPVSPVTIEDARDTFQYYILNKEAFEATARDLKNATVTPYRKDTFILITAGRDGLYGTRDDVKNF